MKLLDGIHLVASGYLGLSLSDPRDCNAYLLVGDGDSVLVDAGCGLGIEHTLALLRRAGAPDVSRVLVTHAHADHAAGACAVAERLGADVWASRAAAAVLEAGDAEAAGLTAAIAAGVYPPSVVLRPTPVARVIGGGTLDVGGLRLDAIETPGHAAGHLAFLAHHARGRVLFSGDAVFARGRVAVLATPDTDVVALAASVERLAALAPDMLFSGHGEPVMRDAAAHLAVASDAFRRQTLPPPLV
ncbi:MBL fold metallo-hydrolase [Conexibacter sp. CPCC 206217]|uniref:MBL fold metallo-hydrolase n=1 Tax=Conexibacter sp. CPCC 206217 TaxID=3064574 RepID=UPI002721B5B1|nr:MBL fold metallo-hydrolase [Conexibacter sp. CPCC 206217]MDO8210323.1 MBL fold metallo-hydrolase [Conexibacter sp. CPCC 206217]